MSRCFVIRLESTPQAPAVARDHVQRFLAAEGDTNGTCGRAAVVVSELVTNAVLHGRRPIELELSADESTVRIEVFDGDRDHQGVARRPVGVDDHHGRGLHVVDALARRWGVDAHARGKVVWAELALANGGPRPARAAQSGNGAA
jgi:anti-sigma regulatory factor (Ser/Thr protein kinase)